MDCRWLAVVAAVCLVMAGCAGEDGGANVTGGVLPDRCLVHESVQPLEFWIKSDGLPFSGVADVLPELAERGFGLYLEVAGDERDDPALYELLDEAERLGVPVKLWPLVSGSPGPWASEDNIDEFFSNVHELLDRVEAAGYGVEWIVIDTELSADRAWQVLDFVEQGRYLEAFLSLLQNRDPDRFAASVERFQSEVDRIRERGYKVQVTSYHFLLDDVVDEDWDIHDMWNVPVLPVDWDCYCFIPYRTAFAQEMNIDLSPYFVFLYAEEAVRLFGRRAEIGVGIVGNSDHGPGYSSPDELEADVSAALAAGARKIDVYHLAGMMDDLDAWLDAIADAVAEFPPPDAASELLQESVRLVDLMLF